MSLYVFDRNWSDAFPATRSDILTAVRDLSYLVVRGVTCETCGGRLLYACAKHDKFIRSDEVTTQKTCPIRDDRGPHGMCGELLVRDVECPANCVNGLVPSPEAIETAASAMCQRRLHWDTETVGACDFCAKDAEAALMAAVDTEET